MPIPKPQRGETKKEFMMRTIEHLEREGSYTKSTKPDINNIINVAEMAWKNKDRDSSGKYYKNDKQFYERLNR